MKQRHESIMRRGAEVSVCSRGTAAEATPKQRVCANRGRFIASAAFVPILACSLPDAEIRISGFPAPDDQCKTTVPAKVYVGTLPLDTAGAWSLGAIIETRNELHGIPIDGTDNSVAFNIDPPNWIQPLRFYVRWECEVTGFSNQLGALYLPSFDLENPFCTNSLPAVTDATRQALDVLPADGPLLPPGGASLGQTGVVIVPRDLGQAIDNMLDVATEADRCCRLSNNCDGRDNPQTGGICAALQDRFKQYSPTAAPQVQSARPGEASAVLGRYAPFSILDGNHRVFVQGSSLHHAQYTMRAHGFLEGVDGTGELRRSNETTINVEICRSCGPLARTFASCVDDDETHPPVYFADFNPLYVNECGFIPDKAIAQCFIR